VRNGDEGNSRAGVDAPLQTGQMACKRGENTTQYSIPTEVKWLFLAKFTKPMEEGVNNDNIGVRRINSRGQDEIEGNVTENVCAQRHKRLRIEPAKISQQMRSRDRGNSMPENVPFLEGERLRNYLQGIFDAICVEMNFALIGMRKTIQQLGESTSVHDGGPRTEKQPRGASQRIHRRRLLGIRIDWRELLGNGERWQAKQIPRSSQR